MSILEQPVNVMNILKSHSLIGIVDDKDHDCILITLNETVAVKYHTIKRKDICQWNTKYSFKSNVVYDWIQQVYAGHFENNVLKMWPESESFIDCVESLRFNVTIHSLISNINDSPFVLFKNGYVSKLNEMIRLRKDPFESQLIPEYDKLLCFNTLILDESKAIFALLVEQNNTKIVITYELNNNNLECLQTFEFQILNASPEMILLAKSTNELSLFVVDSNQKLYYKSLQRGNNVISILVADFESSFENKMVACVIAEHNLIVIYGRAKNRTNRSTLILYDIEAKSIEIEEIFKNKTENYQIWNVQKNLFYVRNLILTKRAISNRKRKFDSVLAHLYENNDEANIDTRTRTIYVDRNIGIFRDLFECKDANAIEKQIDNCYDLLESTLVRLIGFAVRNCDLQSINANNYKARKCTLLNKLLMFEYDHSCVRSLLMDEFADNSSCIVQFLQYLCLAKTEIKVLDWTMTLQECFANRFNHLIRQFVMEIRTYYILPSHIIQSLNKFICSVEVQKYSIVHLQRRVSTDYRIEFRDFNLQFD